MEMDETQTGAVFVQTNAPRNAVVAYERRADGRLVQRAKVETGGSGSGAPHLPSQGSVVLSGDGRFLLVTNAASDDVTLFSVRGAELTVIGVWPWVPRRGASPSATARCTCSPPGSRASWVSV